MIKNFGSYGQIIGGLAKVTTTFSGGEKTQEAINVAGTHWNNISFNDHYCQKKRHV